MENNKSLTLILLISILVPSNGIYSLEEYCDKFIEIFKPYICRVVNFPSTTTTKTTTQQPIRWWLNNTTPEEDWEDDCSCDLTCIAQQQNSEEEERKRSSNNNEFEYICQPCGSDCAAVNINIPTRCTCAVLGYSKKSRCKCTVNCASFRNEFPGNDNDNNDEDGDTPSCIFNVNNLDNGLFSYNNTDHICECKKSKSTENNTMPEFICICQPLH